jgi:hypothetical protein
VLSSDCHYGSIVIKGIRKVKMMVKGKKQHSHRVKRRNGYLCKIFFIVPIRDISDVKCPMCNERARKGMLMRFNGLEKWI